MTTPATRGFHHVTMVSGDARRTVGFYRDLLGFRLVKRTVNFDDPTSYHLYFGTGAGEPGTLVTFFEWRGARRGRWGVGGIHHIALGVARPESQLKWKRRLMDAAVNVSGPYDRGYFRSIYFTDPDGQVLEIATAGPGYAVDEAPGELGRKRDLVPPSAQLRGDRDEVAIRALTHPEPVETIEPDMALDGIHHVTGITDDIERADEFYAAALGLRLVKRSVNQDDPRTPHWFWARYDGERVEPRSSLTLFGWRGSTAHARHGVGQTHHIAFRAAGDAELAAWREHLLGMDIDVSPVMDRVYFRSLYFRAPDGQLVEVATDGPGFTVDEDETALGSALKLPASLEARRPELEAALTPLD